jgi:hypothetical protein
VKFFARKSDPITSHEAANSVDEFKATETQTAILKLLRHSMTDQDLVFEYEVAVVHGKAPRASESGIRSRRAELAERKLVVPVGYKKLESGRRAIVWETA